MEWTRVKNLILGILLLLCLFLSVNLLSMQRSERRIAQEAAAGAVRYLNEAGIQADDTLVPIRRATRRMLLITRDESQEAALAAALTDGTPNADVQAVGVHRYTGPDGEVVWRAGGALEAFTPATATLPEALDGAIRTENKDGYTLMQRYSGMPVFDNLLKVRTEDGTLSISGRWVLGTALPVGDTQEMPLPGLLISFAAQMRTEGQEIDAVTSVEEGYLCETVSGIGVRLVPVWRLTGPGYTAYIDAMDASVSITHE